MRATERERERDKVDCTEETVEETQWRHGISGHNVAKPKRDSNERANEQTKERASERTNEPRWCCWCWVVAAGLGGCWVVRKNEMKMKMLMMIYLLNILIYI
mgnify:CR=1 FL=1